MSLPEVGGKKKRVTIMYVLYNVSYNVHIYMYFSFLSFVYWWALSQVGCLMREQHSILSSSAMHMY